MKTIKNILKLLTFEEKKNYFIITMLLLFSTSLEMVSLALIIPVFNIIFSKPGVMFDNQKSKIINSIMFNLLLIMFSYAIVAV